MQTPIEGQKKDLVGVSENEWRLGLTSFALAVAIYAALYMSTERYRVFGNDWLPAIGWWTLASPESWLKMAAGFVPLFLFNLIVLRVARRQRWAALAWVVLIPLFIVARIGLIERRHSDRTASCANHSGVWWQQFSEDFDYKSPLPGSTEFLDYLLHLWGDEVRSSLHMAACPGSRLSGTKTGVAYVGGGLRLAEIKKDGILIAFCDWRCHPLPYDHQHRLVWEHGRLGRVCSRTTDMIARIEGALAAAKSGEVPYSPDAVAVLVEQLNRRKELRK